MQAKLALIGLTLTVIGTAVMAGEPSCNEPKDKWMKESDFKAQVEKQGIKIKTFKVNKGQCYEVYGKDKDGKKVELFFNPATGAEVKK